MRVQIWLILITLGLAIGAGALGGTRYLTNIFLSEQDLIMALAVIAGTALVIAKRDSLGAAWRFASLSPSRAIWLMAALVFVVSLAGAFVVFQNYPLSMDEFWARADGVILGQGAPLARIPEEWRGYADALQPIFLRLLPEEGLWASTYLPLNSAVQAILGPAASPAMTAGSVLLIAAIARHLMPQDRLAPVIAALLLATSAQVVITAMTSYSMSAHLFLDLLWLWLFLQRRLWAYAASALVALAAMGLHQAAFFPLFALPFLLERFLAGQRLGAIAYVVFIGAGFLAWTNYDVWAYNWFDAAAPANEAKGSGRSLSDLLTRLSQVQLQSLALMGANLVRFVVWQNPILLVLVVLATWPVVRLYDGVPRELRAMLLSLIGTIVFLLLVIPYQGHGWGYRYLHGQLAGAVLIATYAWGRLVSGEHATGWKGVLVGMSALALLFIPVRAYQAHDFVTPYAQAHAELLKWDDADVIIIDAPRHAFTVDLTRNDPLLHNPIKRMDAFSLTNDQATQLCANYRVRFFTDEDAVHLGIPELPETLWRDRRFDDGCLARQSP